MGSQTPSFQNEKVNSLERPSQTLETAEQAGAGWSSIDSDVIIKWTWDWAQIDTIWEDG